MALSQTVPTPQGVDATYWMISRVTLLKVGSAARIYVAGYMDEATRIDEPQNGILQVEDVPVGRADFLAMYDAVENGSASWYPKLYDYVKQQSDLLREATGV